MGLGSGEEEEKRRGDKWVTGKEGEEGGEKEEKEE